MNTATGTGLRRELGGWAAIGLSLALMAPSMAVNINPQGTRGERGTRGPADVRAGHGKGAAHRLHLRPAVPVSKRLHSMDSGQTAHRPVSRARAGGMWAVGGYSRMEDTAYSGSEEWDDPA